MVIFIQLKFTIIYIILLFFIPINENNKLNQVFATNLYFKNLIYSLFLTYTFKIY